MILTLYLHNNVCAERHIEGLLLSNSHYFPVGKKADVGRERRGGSKIISKKEKERQKNNGTKNEMCCLHCFFSIYIYICEYT